MRKLKIIVIVIIIIIIIIIIVWSGFCYRNFLSKPFAGRRVYNTLLITSLTFNDENLLFSCWYVCALQPLACERYYSPVSVYPLHCSSPLTPFTQPVTSSMRWLALNMGNRLVSAARQTAHCKLAFHSLPTSRCTKVGSRGQI